MYHINLWAVGCNLPVDFIQYPISHYDYPDNKMADGNQRDGALLITNITIFSQLST